MIEQAVEATTAEGLLLSGGLDTSVLAAIASQQGRRLRCISVAVADGESPDEPFARQVAATFGLDLKVVRPRLEDLVEQMSALIQLLETFDPMELRNSIAAYVALKTARAEGIRSVLTGDAADELFAGYSYMFNMPGDELPSYILHLNAIMRFTSRVIGPPLGVGVELPYLNGEVRRFALTLTAEDLVGERDGRRFGKKILREAFAGQLPPEIVWRVKTPIELGSGSTGLQRWAASAINDGDFERERKRVQQEDEVELRDKEHLLYYKVYREMFPPPKERPDGAKRCSCCRAPIVKLEMCFCRTCGAYPV